MTKDDLIRAYLKIIDDCKKEKASAEAEGDSFYRGYLSAQINNYQLFIRDLDELD